MQLHSRTTGLHASHKDMCGQNLKLRIEHSNRAAAAAAAKQAPPGTGIAWEAAAADAQLQPQQQQQPPQCSTDSATSAPFEELEYEQTKQALSRHTWAANVRSATGRKHHIIWEPHLSPPALLNSVCVVLVGPKKPISCGTVARACSCFECEDVRVVQPRCDHNTRSSRSVSKGAQYILWRTQVHAELADALADVDLAVAFTRWLPEQQMPVLPDIPSLVAHPVVQQMLQQPQQLQLQQQQQEVLRQAGSLQQQQQQQQQQHTPARIALVFGREEFGLSDEEVAACDVACAISIGRLQESLSLSHAVSIVLAQLFQARLTALAAATEVAPTALPYAVKSADELADGYDSSSGTEH